MTTAPPRPRLLQALLNLRREEVGPVLIATLFFFCVLTALMLLRPARDALGMERGIEGIRWLFIGTALVTLAVNPLFSWLVTRSVQRGITQPARETLFTAVDREEKYKARRSSTRRSIGGGDMIGSQAEGVLARLGWAMGGVVSMVLPVALVWALLALWLGRAWGRHTMQTSATSTPIVSKPGRNGAVRPMVQPAASRHGHKRPRPPGQLALGVDRCTTAR